MGDEEEESTSAETTEHKISRRDVLKLVGVGGIVAAAEGLDHTVGKWMRRETGASQSQIQTKPIAPNENQVVAGAQEAPLTSQDKLNNILSFLKNSTDPNVKNLGQTYEKLLADNRLWVVEESDSSSPKKDPLELEMSPDGWKVGVSLKYLQANELSNEDWMFYFFKNKLDLDWTQQLQGDKGEQVRTYFDQKEKLDEKNWTSTFKSLGNAFGNKIKNSTLLSIKDKYMPKNIPPTPAPSPPRGGIPV